MHRPSPRRRLGSLSAMAMFLALGLVPVGQAQAAVPASKILLAQQPAREARALAHLMNLRTSLGLGDREAFTPARTFTTSEGKTVVHLDHTFDGYRVMGSQAIVHVGPDGHLNTLTHFLKTGVAVAGSPALSPDAAVAIALKLLDAKTPLRDAPRVERIVFPAQFLGDVVTRRDPATGQQVLDRNRSVFAKLPTAYVWAYQVTTRERAGANGPREMAYIIDGDTGALLRADDLLEKQAVTPATGTGTGLYRGAVTFPTSLMADGTYALYDTTRGTLANPYLSGFTPDGSGWSATGLQAWYSEHDPLGNATGNMFLFQANPVNTWGDGQAFTQWGNENGSNGQTAGVDAMSAMATTWDFYAKVLGWNGLDGQGTTAYAEVLATDSYSIDNAYWSNWSSSLTLGAGSSTLPTGNAAYNPAGNKSMADFDVIAHEMTHGVTGSTVGFVNSPGYEEAGMGEATSDFFSEMARIYAARPAGAPDDAIPATGGDWEIGKDVTPDGTPIRWLDKPSRDHRSADAWYDGSRYLDGHYSAGILNRALYFLAQGSSSTQGSDAYSPYLPGGMTGIGNDAAARIWFTTVTERLYSGNSGLLTFMDCRTEAIAAAKDLYGGGQDCVQSIAVENAFAAVNVGDGHGQPPRTQVLFANWRNGDYVDISHNDGTPGGFYANRQNLPIGETVVPRITVLNNANTAVTWTLGGPSLYNGATYTEKGGVINPDGSWTTPYNVGWQALTATSQADPTQFAEGRAFLINMDTDMDLETDAIDMGGIAFSWYLSNALNPAHSMYNAPWVDDADVAAFVDAMTATWPVK